MCEQDGVHYLAGLVSFGPPCTNSNSPGVYADVHRYLDWIDEDHRDYDYKFDESKTPMYDDVVYDYSHDQNQASSG